MQQSPGRGSIVFQRQCPRSVLDWVEDNSAFIKYYCVSILRVDFRVILAQANRAKITQARGNINQLVQIGIVYREIPILKT
jgi:hypothetical protein